MSAVCERASPCLGTQGGGLGEWCGVLRSVIHDYPLVTILCVHLFSEVGQIVTHRESVVSQTVNRLTVSTEKKA